MGQMRNTKLLRNLIIVVLLIILVLVGVIAYLYFGTNILKSNKKLFFKYFEQATSSEQGIIDNEIVEYFKKKGNSQYTNDGKITATAKMPNTTQQKAVDDFNITFKGEVDKINGNQQEEISLNYSDNINFPFIYRKVGEIVGIQTNNIGKNFIAINIDNTNSLEDNTESVIETITDNLNKVKEVEAESEKNQKVLNRYIQLVYQNLDKSKFVKVEEGGSKGYRLSLTLQEIKDNIISKPLETIKTDEEMLKILSEEDIEKIEDNLEKINEESIEENIQVDITIYIQDNKFSKLTAKADKLDISLEKIQTDGKYNIRLAADVNEEGNKTSIFFSTFISGLDSMQNIQESYEIKVGLNDSLLGYKVDNTINFVDSINIENFTNENSINLSQYNEETVSNFQNAVQERINQVNAQQMQELGLKENENPLILPISNFISSLTKQMFGGFRTNSNYDDLSSSLSSDFSNDLNVDTESQETSGAEILKFNSEYQMYENTVSSGQTTRGLMTVMDSNNEGNKYNYKIEEINFNGSEYEATKENIAFIKGDITTDKIYKIEFERDEDTGAIYRVVINEQKQQTEE